MRKIFLLIFGVLFISNAWSQVIVSDRLQAKINALNPLEYTRVLVLLKDRVDIETLDQQLYAMNTPLEQRSYIVITTLRNKAAQTQGPILNYINQQTSFGKVKQFIPYWITNMIFVECTADVIYELSKRADVDMMDLDAELTYDKPVSIGPAPEVTESAEIGLKAIRADSLWMIGITGQGRTVMHIDTGVDPTHPALGYKWWGNNGRPAYHSWFDPTPPINPMPYDCGNHGTHTMGIMTGRSTTDTVGVAPDARWIAAGVTDCPGASYPSSNIAAFQWAIDPDTNASTLNSPDVISCSWQDPSQSGQTQCTGIYVATMNAVEAAGIAVCFSAGNSGPGASTLTPPKNLNIDSVTIFAVGAVDGNQSGWPIASFSSRGPSICGGQGTLLIKPEVSAPGVSVRSSVPGNSYSTMSGTSMASPHVAGAIALLKQAAPTMTGKQLKAILFSTCTDLGTPGEDNTYGMGIINVYSAYKRLGPNINHTPLPNTENLSGPFIVNCTINPAQAPINPALTKLHYSRNNTNITDSIALTNTGGNNWTATIPSLNAICTYRYFIRTYDLQGKVGTSPAGAPATVHIFQAGPDNVKPVITHTPLADVPKPNFPPTITAMVVDPSDYGGLDSVWIRWYKNSTSNGVFHVKMSGTGGNNFSAVLNQPNSYVNYNDSIFYRIIAQDNSSAHNKDSTVLHKFKIVSTVTACVGTGTTNTAWPFNTFWHDSRTQMLYTASEITAAGGAAGNIFQIGFNVSSAASQVMNGFNVRFQHTTATSITGWVTTGWTTVYTGTYQVPGTGLQYITLQGSGFDYNGTSNLLVEICFDNTSYTSATNVASTSVSSMAREYHTDGSTGCSMTSGSSVARPNACFKINTIVGVPNANIELPKQFALSQNYPNPFNPTTTISYSIPKSNNVVFTIYDITGKEVAKLVNEYKQAGTYLINFDASHLASGMYFYRIEAGDFVDTKKMVLVK